MGKERKNQLVMKEGVLPYREGGKIVYKLKRWDDWKEAIGVDVKTVVEHPRTKVLTENDTVYDSVKIKQCVNNKKALCVDLPYNPNRPDLGGYSLGYMYEEIKEPGVFNGVPYDVIQKYTAMDHLAFTNYRREPDAIATDSTNFYGECFSIATDSTEEIDKYLVGYDSYKDLGSEFSMEEKDKEIMELKAEIAKLNAIKVAGDSYKIEIDALKSDLSNLKNELEEKKKELKTANDSYLALVKEKENAELSKAKELSAELLKLGVDSNDLEGASPAEITRIYKIVASKPTTGTTVGETGNDSVDYHSTNDYYFDRKSGEFKLKGGKN